jgi:PadR family transcriptional regulator AphA
MASSMGKKRTRTAYAVLGFLAKGAKSGYEIKQDIEERAGHFWNESFGQIYPILKKLDKDGLIEKVDSEQTGKRSRQRYAITESGLEELKEWIEDPVEFEVIRSELLLKLFCGAHVDIDTSLQHLADYKSHLLRLQKRIKKTRANLSPQLNAETPDAVCKLATLDWGIEGSNMSLKWIEKTKEQLKSSSS